VPSGWILLSPPRADRRLPVGFTVTTPFVVPIADPVTTVVLVDGI
jgi:hypothetical protein